MSIALIRGIGGVDEAGRGPLAGPVIAAAVVLAPGQHIPGVRDSKRLSARRREELAVVIRRESVAWGLGRADVEEIDRLNILQATLLAMRRAVEAMACTPRCLRFDGNAAPSLPGFAGQTETLVGGDGRCSAIAAASILAKTSRDAEMIRLDRIYPEYGFARHKGYPTRDHRQILVALGPCPAHRQSYRPVQLALRRLEGQA